MDLLLWNLEHVVTFGVASVPLILTFVQLKIFKVSRKSISVTLVLQMFCSIYFWIKLNSLFVAIYQTVPYISSFIWLWADYKGQDKRDESRPLE